MRALSATQVRKDFYSILKEKKTIEVKYKEGNAIILSKEEFEKMESQILKTEIEKVINSGQKILSDEEVKVMVNEVLNA